MYESFFGLRARPFQLSPDPDFFYASETHSKGLAYLHYGISQGEGFVVVTGIPGTGKTTLLNTLMSELPPNRFLVAKLSNTLLDTRGLFRTISLLFGLKADGESKVDLLRELELFLVQQARTGKKVLLLIDEAHNLTVELLEELRLLSNFQFRDKFIMQTFLLGQQQLEDTLNLPEMLQLRQRVLVSHRLEPILRHETGAYIEHRLNTSGWRGTPEFSSKSLLLIHHYTDGIPRQINTLSDRVLLYACMEEITLIDETVVESVVNELRLEPASYVHGRNFTEADLSEVPVVCEDQTEMDFAADLDVVEIDSTSLALKKAFDLVDKPADQFASNVVAWPPSLKRADVGGGDSSVVQGRSQYHTNVQNGLAECLDETIVPFDHDGNDIGQTDRVPLVDKEKEDDEHEDPAFLNDEHKDIPLGESTEGESTDIPTDEYTGLSLNEELDRSAMPESAVPESVRPQKIRRYRYLLVAGVLLLPVLLITIVSMPGNDAGTKPLLSENTQVVEPVVVAKQVTATQVAATQSDSLASLVDEQVGSVGDIDVVNIVDGTEDLIASTGKDEQAIDIENESNIDGAGTSFSAFETQADTGLIVQTAAEVQTVIEPVNPVKSDNKPVELVVTIEAVAKPDVVKQPSTKSLKPKLAKKENVVTPSPYVETELNSEKAAAIFPAAVKPVTQTPDTSTDEKALAAKAVEKHDIKIDTGIADDVLNEIVVRFRDAYQAGDLDRFISLFSANVDTNEVKGVEDVKDEYKKLFDFTDQREIVIDDVSWQKDKRTALGNGAFYVSVKEKGANRSTTYKGSIKLEVASDAGLPDDVRITKLYYSYND